MRISFAFVSVVILEQCVFYHPVLLRHLSFQHRLGCGTFDIYNATVVIFSLSRPIHHKNRRNHKTFIEFALSVIFSFSLSPLLLQSFIFIKKIYQKIMQRVQGILIKRFFSWKHIDYKLIQILILGCLLYTSPSPRDS